MTPWPARCLRCRGDRGRRLSASQTHARASGPGRRSDITKAG